MKKLVLHTSGGDFLIDTSAIVRVEASSNYSKLFFSDGKVLVTAKLISWFEEKLQPESFTRLHRSHLINNRYLQDHQCLRNSVQLQNGKVVPVSRRRKKMVLLKLAAACMFLFFFSPVMFSQNVGVGTNTPHSSTQLDVVSTTKGLGIPSMTTSQRLAIISPKAGVLVFDLEKNTVFMYDGAQWLALLFATDPKNIPPIIRKASDGETGDWFGSSVAIEGNYAVVGAQYHDANGNNDQGAAYVFFRNSNVWTQQAKLVASDGAAGDNFGCGVSIDGNYIIVGARSDNTTANATGSAYVFIRSGTNWTQQAKLTAANAAENDRFGNDVCISGAYAVIGASGDDIGANLNEGSAYFFHRTGTVWTQEDYVVAPFGEGGDAFGNSVSISGNFAVIGAYVDDVSGNSNQGSAHVFERIGTNWDYHAGLTGSSGNSDDEFGTSVSIDGNYIIVGAPYGGSFGGRAYVFLRNGAVWDQQATFDIQPHPNLDPVNFGCSVSIDGDQVIIGATLADIGEFSHIGAAYVFKRNGAGWKFVRRIYDQTFDAESNLGFAVAISGFNVLVSSSTHEMQKGRVYFLNIE